MDFELVPKEAVGIPTATPTGRRMPYTGSERRKQSRRILVDRRVDFRFEAKPDRRGSDERRTDQKLWNGRHF